MYILTSEVKRTSENMTINVEVRPDFSYWTQMYILVQQPPPPRGRIAWGRREDPTE